MIKVNQREDGSFDIFWDENDPVESMFNTWTKGDFENAIANYLDKLNNDEK